MGGQTMTGVPELNQLDQRVHARRAPICDACHVVACANHSGPGAGRCYARAGPRRGGARPDAFRCCAWSVVAADANRPVDAGPMDAAELAIVVSGAARWGNVPAMKLRDEQLRRAAGGKVLGGDPLVEIDELATRRAGAVTTDAPAS
jgi:hypothetical protein